MGALTPLQRSPAIGRRSGTRTVWHRSSTGERPAANSTSARPVPRNEGSTPSTSPANGMRARTPTDACALPAPARGMACAAGRGRPASFAAHIWRTFMRGMEEKGKGG